MGTLILLIAFITEAAFATYCMITRSNQKKVSSLLRLGAFAAFVLCALFSIIEWSFRWYGLAVLLLIWAVFGVWTLVGKPRAKRAYSAGRLVGKAITILLLIAIVITPALIFPQYKSPPMTGKLAVATSQFTYTDENRTETFTDTGEQRKVNVAFWYPKDGAEQYPLVVFSHGAFGVKNSNTSTFRELASNGYVVCSIDHPYHALYTVGDDGHRLTVDRSFLQEVLDVNRGAYAEATQFEIEQKWLQLRTADIHFVLDTIRAQTRNTGADALYQRIDLEKIGLMGHSLGGASSAQVARERNDIDAVINLDADLFGEYLTYVDGKYVLNDTIYPVPLLTIYADDMVRLFDAIKDPTVTVAVKHVTATARHAYEIHLPDTNHMSLTDLPLISPFLVSVINASVPKGGGDAGDAYATLAEMNEIVLAFFNAYLKDEGDFSATGTW